MKKTLISIFLFIFIASPGFSNEKIVYLDVEKIMKDSLAGKSIISQLKKGRILNNKYQIIEMIRNDLNDNDYLMIKASNATGFNKIVNELKGLN